MIMDDPADLDKKVAGTVRRRRRTLALTLEQVSDRSGVSRAMISKIERGEVSPSAVVLGRLTSALGMTLSQLFADERAPSAMARAVERPVWRDPATGYRRRNVAPTLSPLEIVDVVLPSGARVDYANPVPLAVEQLVWVLEGRLTVTLDGVANVLEPGDCLAMRLDRPIAYQNLDPEPARYAVVLAAGFPAARA